MAIGDLLLRSEALQNPVPLLDVFNKGIGSSVGSTKAELPNLSGESVLRPGEPLISSPSSLLEPPNNCPLIVTGVPGANELDAEADPEDGPITPSGFVPMGAIGRVMAPNPGGGTGGFLLPMGSIEDRRLCAVLGPGEKPDPIAPIGPGDIIGVCDGPPILGPGLTRFAEGGPIGGGGPVGKGVEFGRKSIAFPEGPPGCITPCCPKPRGTADG